MFVGDSLNRGQWISMVCLLQSVIPANKRSMTPNAQLTIFRAEVRQETSSKRFNIKNKKCTYYIMVIKFFFKFVRALFLVRACLETK